MRLFFVETTNKCCAHYYILKIDHVQSIMCAKIIVIGQLYFSTTCHDFLPLFLRQAISGMVIR